MYEPQTLVTLTILGKFPLNIQSTNFDGLEYDNAEEENIIEDTSEPGKTPVGSTGTETKGRRGGGYNMYSHVNQFKNVY